MAIDVNDLKIVNDTEGHAAGDAVIQAVATFLEENVRGYDVCCRTGGDEFLVLLPDTDERASAQLVARMQRRMSELRVPGRAAPIAMSIGVATYPDDAASGAELVARADEAMYAHKRGQKRPRDNGRRGHVSAEPAATSAPGA